MSRMQLTKANSLADGSIFGYSGFGEKLNRCNTIGPHPATIPVRRVESAIFAMTWTTKRLQEEHGWCWLRFEFRLLAGNWRRCPVFT